MNQLVMKNIEQWGIKVNRVELKCIILSADA